MADRLGIETEQEEARIRSAQEAWRIAEHRWNERDDLLYAYDDQNNEYLFDEVDYRSTDDRGRIIHIGDTVQVLYINRDRGAEMWMHRGTVVSFGRTRLQIQFPSRTKPQSVGSECVRVIDQDTRTEENN